MVRAFTVALILAASLAAAVGADLPQEALKFLNLSYDDQQKAVTSMPAKRRQVIAKAIKAYARQHTIPEQFNLHLVQLRDDETIKALTGQFVLGTDGESANAISYLMACRDAKVIGLIGPALLHEDDFIGAKFNVYLRSPQAAAAISPMLPGTPGFSEDLHQWATRIESQNGYVQLQILQQWWRANEKHFAAGDYGKVRPGAEPPPWGTYTCKIVNGRWEVVFIDADGQPTSKNWTPQEKP